MKKGREKCFCSVCWYFSSFVIKLSLLSLWAGKIQLLLLPSCSTWREEIKAQRKLYVVHVVRKMGRKLFFFSFHSFIHHSTEREPTVGKNQHRLDELNNGSSHTCMEMLCSFFFVCCCAGAQNSTQLAVSESNRLLARPTQSSTVESECGKRREEKKNG